MVTQLTPLTLLDRSERSFPARVALEDERRRWTYAEFASRCRRLAQGLREWGVSAGDRVAVIGANSRMLLELHYAVPSVPAVLVPLNVRLSPAELVGIIDHSGSRLIIASREFAEVAHSVAEHLGLPVLVGGSDDYEQLAAAPEALGLADLIDDENSLISINYTSGTTGQPKGVMCTHRGAHLQSLGVAFHAGLSLDSRYLWTLPMFHCNGWCFVWAVVAVGGTQVSLPVLDVDLVWRELGRGVTHFSAAPTVLTMIAESTQARVLAPRVQVQTGGAPPTPALLARMDRFGLEISHLYGLTETYGPLCVNDWPQAWSSESPERQAGLKARQGVGHLSAGVVRVVDSDMNDVPRDGTTVGEIVASGNTVTSGYYKDDAATSRAFVAGWFMTGDLAVVHPDGYLEIKDRSKDIIISGGENISSVEVERVLSAHPDVIESAVVARPDDKWGETPVAFVVTRGAVTVEDLKAHARRSLAGFKVPRQIHLVAELPKTSTGKVRKQDLRQVAAEPD